uniref:Reverse transcriptase n=1 Tax=Cannabis sativa TaxID=3483 RepID=A0A803P9D0_CANSA
MVKRDCENKLLHGFPCGRDGPVIYHLLFADYSFFFKAFEGNYVRFKQLLNWYGVASGQMVNFDKSTICISPNVLNSQKDYLVDLLGFKGVECHVNYLGLHCFPRHRKSVPPGLVLIPHRLDGLAKVFVLCDTSGGWNKELIWSSFQFTVKSGYWLARRNLALTRASSSNGFSGWWKKIRPLNLPHKARDYLGNFHNKQQVVASPRLGRE